MQDVKQGEVLTFQGVDVYSKNFRGDKFGPGGTPSIGFFIDEDTAKELAERNCPGLKWTKPYEDAPEDWVSRPWIKASMGYKARPPSIYQITSRGARLLDADTLGVLQNAKIDGPIDIAVRAASYDVNGTVGIKLWVTEAYIKIEESVLAAKYAHLLEEGELEAHNEDEEDD